ncbi:MAG: adenosine kinase [Pseudomonadota bacterium]
MTKTYNIVGIGNAVSDVIAKADDAFLGQMGIEKGIMQLVEKDRASDLYAAMQDRTETPGGSVANTISGLGSLGVKTAFVGRVADDDLGQRYADTMAQEGTAFPNAPIAGSDLPTSRSMIFVSPDGERSMNTYLGVSSDVGPADVSADVIKDSAMLFLEGYLFDKDPGKAAFYKAAEAAQSAGAMAGISLSDPFCVDRHRDDFRKLVSGPLDFFLCNEDELKSLYQTDDLNAALDAGAADCRLVVCTRSADGVSIRNGADRWDVPVTPVTPVDATGAGDQFAAGFLYGMIQGKDFETCGKMGGIAAGEVIAHVGPRPNTSIAALFEKANLI